MEVLEGTLERKHLVITCWLNVKDQEIPAQQRNDCGATGIAFMDKDFAPHYQIPVQELKEMRQDEVIDGRPIESGAITHIAKLGWRIQDY